MAPTTMIQVLMLMIYVYPVDLSGSISMGIRWDTFADVCNPHLWQYMRMCVILVIEKIVPIWYDLYFHLFKQKGQNTSKHLDLISYFEVEAMIQQRIIRRLLPAFILSWLLQKPHKWHALRVL